MATINFPKPNLKPIPYKQITFEDWTGGMVTSVEGDNRDPKTSNLIRNLTNRYRGKLVMPGTVDTDSPHFLNSYCASIERFKFVYINDEEYILAWMNGKTASTDTLEIVSTTVGPTDNWTELAVMSTDDVVDFYNGELYGTFICFSNVVDHVSQSFTTGKTGLTLYKATFSIASFGSPGGYVYAELFAHSGTYGVSSVPTGSALATSDALEAGALGSGPYDVEFTFTGDDMVSMDANEHYCIVVRYEDGDAVDYLGVSVDPYVVGHSGNAAYNDGMWCAEPNRDINFMVTSKSRVSYFDSVVSSSDGAPVIYVTYEKDDGGGDTLKITYRDQVDSMPYVKWSPTFDESEDLIPLCKVDEPGVLPSAWSSSLYGEYLNVSPVEHHDYLSGDNLTNYDFGDTAITSQGQKFLGYDGTGSKLATATFFLKTTGSPAGTVTAKLYADSSGVPGSELAESESLNASDMTSGYGFHTFTFTDDDLVSVDGVSTQYHIALAYSTSSATDYISAGGDNDGSAAPGNRVELVSSTWTAYASTDLIYRVDIYTNAFGTAIGGLDDLVSPGDMLMIGKIDHISHDRWVGCPGTIPYMSIVEVLEVDDYYIKLNRTPYPGLVLAEFNSAEVHAAILSLDWLETVGSEGWYCRSIAVRKPWDLMTASDTSSGVFNNGYITTNFVGDDLEAGIAGETTLQYGFSYGYDGGQGTGMALSNMTISGEAAATHAYSQLEISYDYETAADDRIFRNWDSDLEDSDEVVLDDVTELIVWRRKRDEEEYGFMARAPRTKDRVLTSIKDITADGTSFWLKVDNNGTLNFVNIAIQQHESAAEEFYPIIGCNKYFYDIGDVLAETYRTVHGVDLEDAQNSIYGRTVASSGQRLFFGNVHFPTNNDQYDTTWMDDEVVYSTANCGSMFSLDNKLGYRTGETDSIVDATIHSTNLYLFKLTSCAVISIAGDSEFAWTPRGEFQQGLLDPRLKCGTPHGTVWFSRDGLYMYSENSPVNISRDLHDEYMAGIEDLDDCSISYEPRYNRIYVVLDDDAYWFGLDQIERGWKQCADSFIDVSVNDSGCLCGHETINIHQIESDVIKIKRLTDFEPAWHSGELTLGAVGEEIKLKRAYIWYEYKRVTVTPAAKIELQWWIDGELEKAHELDISDDTGALTSNLEKVYLSGRGRRVEFRVEVTSGSADEIRYFELKKVEIVYKTTRLK